MNKPVLNKILFAVLILLSVSYVMGNFASAEMNSGPDTDMVNINEASVKELAGLSGIGKSKAEAIIAYRSENGKFESVDDIKKVKGIGSKTFENIRDKITAK